MRSIYLRSLLLVVGLVALATLDLLAPRHGSSRTPAPAAVGAVSHPA